MTRALASILATLAVAGSVLAQSTAITYQGELKNSGSPASGQYDVRFKLFDSLSGGTQVGPTQCVDNAQVSGGKFAATLDFGQQFATTSPRYIEIEVRADTGQGCATTSGYTTLSPRHALTAAPRALAATTASSLTIPNGSSLLVNITNEGKVGVGTATPTSQFELAGVQDALRLNAYQPTITFQDTSSANNRSILQGVNGGVFCIGEQFLSGANGAAFTYMNSGGDLALGHYTPQAKLDVNGGAVVRGTLQLGPTGAYRATGGEENLRIVRGTISAGGNVVHGSGFQCTRTSFGRYSIVFNTPFIGTPSVTATNEAAGGLSRWISTSVTSTDFVVYIVGPNFQGEDNQFHFIAVGPR